MVDGATNALVEQVVTFVVMLQMDSKHFVPDVYACAMLIIVILVEFSGYSAVDQQWRR